MVKVSQTELIAGAIAGKIVSFPTDTVPALAVKPNLGQLIFQLKQRPQHKPLILMAGSIEDLLPYIQGNQSELATWQQVAAQYLPGALTLVLPTSSQVNSTSENSPPTTIGIRVPKLEIACQILKQTGVLATTSANLSGQPPLTTMNKIDRAFPNVLVLEDCCGDQEFGSGLPSTVVKWSNQQWTVLRQGSIQFTSDQG